MSNRKAGAYGTNDGGDTGFRKTWDREEYAAKAAESEAKAREEGKARHEAALQGRKYVRRAETPPDARETEARAQRLDVSKLIGKQSLVPAGAAIGKRGRGAGFYCESCDLTLKDNLQWVDHLNSIQHQKSSGASGLVKKATLEEVRDHFEWIKRKRDEEKEDENVDLQDRLDRRRNIEEQEREEKRRRRNEKRRKNKTTEDD